MTPPSTNETRALDPELVARVQHVADAVGKDRQWKAASLTGHDWRRLAAFVTTFATPPQSPAGEREAGKIMVAALTKIASSGQWGTTGEGHQQCKQWANEALQKAEHADLQEQYERDHSAHPTPASDEVREAICTFRPLIEAKTPEPSLRAIVYGYYREHFSAGQAGRLTEQYLAAILALLPPATPTPDQAENARLREDAALLDALRENSWDLRCFDMPTGGDDADIGWRVIGHWMAEPQERTVAEVYTDDPRAAIRLALNPEAPGHD